MSGWPAVASAVAAWLAFLLSVSNLFINVRATHRQEERRRPRLVPYYHDGFYRGDAGGKGRVYAFLIALSNRSDTNNTVAELELRITYTNAGGIQATLKIRAESQKRFDLEPPDYYLAVPQRVDGHQSMLGWCHFIVTENTLKQLHRIERYVVAAIDGDGTDAAIEPILLSARNGPRDKAEAQSLV
jgi:hypothetical protein